MQTRCSWCVGDLAYEEYHDTEWGVPVHDDLLLFQALMLEIMQAGLSFSIILKKRRYLLEKFYNFDPTKVKEFSECYIKTLLSDVGIIRNKMKVAAVIKNSICILACDLYQNFSKFIWNFTGNKVISGEWKNESSVPCQTAISFNMAKDLKKLGFVFVGPKLCYSFMQAVGLVNDHVMTCHKFSKAACFGLNM